MDATLFCAKIRYLELDKNALYRQLHSWSLYQLKRMLTLAGCHCALEAIRETLSKSASTQSRNRMTISVDDTVLKQCGACLSYIYSWWSGQYNRTLDGQNLLAITIRIGQTVIPLSIRPVDKQGRANTQKPDLLKAMLTDVLDFFSEAGIDSTQFPITFDSWYGSQPLREVLVEMGFSVQLVDTKSNYVFTIDQKKQSQQRSQAGNFSPNGLGLRGESGSQNRRKSDLWLGDAPLFC